MYLVSVLLQYPFDKRQSLSYRRVWPNVTIAGHHTKYQSASRQPRNSSTSRDGILLVQPPWHLDNIIVISPRAALEQCLENDFDGRDVSGHYANGPRCYWKSPQLRAISYDVLANQCRWMFTMVSTPLADKRPSDALRAASPLNADGIRLEPTAVRSVCYPGLVAMDTYTKICGNAYCRASQGLKRALSCKVWVKKEHGDCGTLDIPPLAPPADKVLLYGFTVKPIILLAVSPI